MKRVDLFKGLLLPRNREALAKETTETERLATKIKNSWYLQTRGPETLYFFFCMSKQHNNIYVVQRYSVDQIFGDVKIQCISVLTVSSLGSWKVITLPTSETKHGSTARLHDV